MSNMVAEYEHTIKATMEISFTPRALFRLKCVYDMGIIFDGKPTEEEFNETVKIILAMRIEKFLY